MMHALKSLKSFEHFCLDKRLVKQMTTATGMIDQCTCFCQFTKSFARSSGGKIKVNMDNQQQIHSVLYKTKSGNYHKN